MLRRWVPLHGRATDVAAMVLGIEHKDMNYLIEIRNFRMLLPWILDSWNQTFALDFAYDGKKSWFMLDPLPRNKLEFTIALEDVVSSSPNDDRKRQRRPYNSKTIKVEISFAAKILMQSIANALCGQESENSQETLRILDIILRQGWCWLGHPGYQ
ncbi:hypothetical protein RHSIM_Rhsim01G0044900 [Rhododendron simsii]|uniref:Protein argonaute N-terminal domain-containing protein n=1 Tax=Rhododendron simsii TaxID=118357 RepID=A0A834HG07_RHOSS|nr:hypothetical protein RHSIM_Rhsim01G0044900 [Rhododendron simsii]